MKIRTGNIKDLVQIENLALDEWTQYKKILTEENWSKLYATITNENTFHDLLINADSFVCENENKKIIGFSFLVPSGNPNEIFNQYQASIRFVTVSNKYSGHKIGERLTESCVAKATENKEEFIALHTSEFMDKARHIYEKLGFKIIKDLDQRLGKKYWLYELKL